MKDIYQFKAGTLGWVHRGALKEGFLWLRRIKEAIRRFKGRIIRPQKLIRIL